MIAEAMSAVLMLCISIKEREEILIANGRGHVTTDGLRQMWQAEIDKYGNKVQEKVDLSVFDE